MRPDSNHARFYIGKPVPLSSPPFYPSRSYPSRCDVCSYKLQNTAGLFWEPPIHLLPWIQRALLLGYLLLGASFPALLCLLRRPTLASSSGGGWAAIRSLLVFPFQHPNSEWWCGSGADVTCQIKWMGMEYLCYFEMPNWIHFQLVPIFLLPCSPPQLFIKYVHVYTARIVSAAPSEGFSQTHTHSHKARSGIFPALTLLAAHHFHNEYASAVIRRMLSVGFSSHLCSLNTAEVPFSL